MTKVSKWNKNSHKVLLAFVNRNVSISLALKLVKMLINIEK